MKGYKTIAVNGAAALIPLIDFTINNGEWLGLLLGPQGAVALSALGLINVVLRWITDTPVFKDTP